jgi:hypothetical protein
VKAAAVAEVPSGNVPDMGLILAADIGDEQEQVGKRGAGRRTRSRPAR